MFEKIKELIAEELGADAATITKETTNICNRKYVLLKYKNVIEYYS
ncbi:hypothetical protein [uncultured Clostridium sp.]|nr:hypothetical protein [uncultured Clostridium sp.]